MYPSSYHCDGTGRDIGIFNHGTRTCGKAHHVNATDHAAFLPRLERARLGALGSAIAGTRPEDSSAMLKKWFEREVHDVGPSPWDKTSYSTIYRDVHCGATAARDFAGSKGNGVPFSGAAPFTSERRTPSQTPRYVAPSLQIASTYRSHFGDGDPLPTSGPPAEEKPGDTEKYRQVPDLSLLAAGATPGPTPPSTYRSHYVDHQAY
mmetsp:Transcript_39385/g.108528  ORF Transcript_39385/g.108528 Transcript_39385/m.108528 type:complete len:206 (-) Transcript_39385:118-735(-)